MATPLESPTALAKLIGISVSYASALLSGSRPWTTSLALRLHKATGEKVGTLEGATEREIEILARYNPEKQVAA